MSALDRELATLRGFASCRGDDACLDEAEAELAELRAGRHVWQPIETAPRDGSYVIVWPPTWRGVTSCARFDDDMYARNPRPFWRRLDASGITESRDSPPTHWRPVLTGPEGGGE